MDNVAVARDAGDEKRITITLFGRGEKSHGRAVSITVAQLHALFRAGSKAKTKEELGGWSPATYRRNHRKLEHLVQVSMAVLDIDNTCGKDQRVPDDALVTMDKMMSVVGEVDTFIYSSFRHSPGWPKFRAVMPLSRPLDASEYPRFWSVLSKVMSQQGVATDPQAKDGCRLWYLSSQHAPHFETRYHPGKPLDVDAYLAMYVEPPRAVRVVSSAVFVESEQKLERARQYLSACPPAVEGSEGSRVAFGIISRVVRGFALTETEAMYVLSEWNSRCSPPWSDKELSHKIQDAIEKGQTEIGALLDPNRKPTRVVLSPEELKIIKKARKS